MFPLSSSSSSSYSSISRKKYDVFLSFRGKDTRKNFTDHLYAALKRNGIVTFRDDPRLEAGEEIKPELLKAIEESWCSLIVFSETYAFSDWCLDELEEIVEQRNKRGHKIFPIFYDVDPSDLRNQTAERVAEAFAKHEERYKENKERTERWRTILTEVANIKGWHLRNRHESEFIGDIARKISAKLCQTYSVAPDDKLIGINSRLEELHSKINIGEDDIRIVGVCGMGGIGKTTLARVIYTQMSPHFEGKSFLADVREFSEKNGLVSLQKQLLSEILLEEGFNLFNVYEGNAFIRHRLAHKRVLIVIDDADNIQHLKCLVGRHDWFGLGSRIIVTTRDEHLLRSYGVDDVYKPNTLNAEESFRLFSLKAFNTNTVPKIDFFELSKRVVKYADGLPLALEVLGSFLCGRDVAQWRNAIERLKKDVNKEIIDRLQISFDGLEETEKNIFLDMACFFNSEEKDFVIKILDGCGFFASIGIDVLIKKSLIKVDEDNKYLQMHHLLQEMGRKIVRQKSHNEPGKRSRLWEKMDVYKVLTKNMATDSTECMVIDIDGEHNKTFTLNGDAFSKMTKLRLLKVFSLPNSCELKYLSDELRLLDWSGYPLRTLPSSFQPDNLVALLLPYSRTEQLWKEKRPLHNLTLVNLKASENLIKVPDFTMAPNLESLILEGCARIIDVHPSIGVLRRLKHLNLRGCKRFRSLPIKIGMESLETLILSGCSNLQRFPEIDGEMKYLLELYLDGTGIKELPSSIGHLSNLVFLNLKDCKNLVSLPTSIGGCKSLKTLNLSGCSKVETLPENLQQVEFLEELDLSKTAIRKPLSFVFQFKNLKVLSFDGCKAPPTKLRPNLPSLFKVLQRGSADSMGLMLPPMSALSSLTQLNLSNCGLCEGAIPSDICCLSSLEILNLRGNNFMYLPANITRLSKLLYLILSDCKHLLSVPELQKSVRIVSIDGCDALEVYAKPKKAHYKSIDCAYIIGTNCYRILENSNASTMLKIVLKVFANPRRVSDIIVPGSEIPEWFSHKRNESSIKIPMPPNILNDSQWMGVAFCCVFASVFNDDAWEGIGIRVNINGKNSRSVNCYGFGFGRKYRRPCFMKMHLWLRYWSRDELYPFPLEKKYGETKNLLSTNTEDERCDEVFELEIYCNGSLKLNKCGVQLVYEKDLEEQCSGTASDEFTWNGGLLVKPKRNIFVEEVGWSESDSAEQTSQPKPLENFLNFIEGRKISSGCIDDFCSRQAVEQGK